MALTHIASLRDTFAASVKTEHETGAGFPVFRLLTVETPAGVCDITLLDPSWITGATGEIDLDTTGTLTGTVVGGVSAETVDKFQCVRADGTTVSFDGSVGLVGSGADMEMTNTLVNTSDIITLDAMTYQATQ